MRGRRRDGLTLQLVTLVAALSVTACSSTHQETRPTGDVLVRSGPTLLGWAAMLIPAVLAAAVILTIGLVLLAVAGEAFTDSVKSRKFFQAIASALSLPVVVGVVGAMGWLVAANTVLKYQTAVVTASSTSGELTVRQGRLVGGPTVRSWHYTDIAEIRFDYIPGTGGEDSTPPRGVVYVRGAGQEASPIFDGSPCPARELAEAVSTATKVPIHVRSGFRDISSIGSFLTQIRCGIQRPPHPTGGTSFAAEAWRVLDLPFLWRWPWSVPIVIGQILLIAVALVAIARWRDERCPRIVMIAVCCLAVLGIAAMNIFATRSYGSWPAALALFLLISAMVVRRVLFGGTLSFFANFLGSDD